MYQVLYRKWRPMIFSDVIGQEHITRILQNEIINNTTAHAYLFTGSRGTGKTTCAKILSKSVNCLSPVNGDPCNLCSNCIGIDNMSILDVSEIDAASNNGVDNIRDIREEAVFSPAVAKKRVFIIDEAHMLSIGAFNALLKILEEPPEHVMFILATTEEHKIPRTILSRCQRFDFKRIEPEEIKKRLLYIAEKENIELDDLAALLIAKLSDGAMRDALSLLDQCKSYDKVITEQLISDITGLTSQNYIFELTDNIIDKDLKNALSIINNLHKMSKNMTWLCEELINHFRNLLMIKSVKNPEQFLVYSSSDFSKLKEQSERLHLFEIMKILKILSENINKTSASYDKKLNLEMAFVSICEDKNKDVSLNEINSRILKLEDKISELELNGVTQKEDITPKKNKKTKTEIIEDSNKEKSDKNEPDINNTEEKPANSLNLYIPTEDAVEFEKWNEVLSELSDASKPLLGVLESSKAYISGNYLLIDSNNSMFTILIKQQSYKETLRKAILKVTNTRYLLGPYKKRPEKEINFDDPLLQLEDVLKKSGIDYTVK